MMRIGFLFNHDQIHQIAHSLPIALALAKSDFDGEIIVATSNDHVAAEVRRLAGDSLGQRLHHVELRLSRKSALLARAVNAIAPASKLLIYQDNLDFFRSLDMLIVSEKTSLILKTRYGLNDLFMVHTRHGAGDRAIGFNKASLAFDHNFCSGPKVRRRLIEEVGVDSSKISIVGYPKFDLLPHPQRSANAPRHKPNILYNPHPSPHLSSWYKHGRALLDQFIGNEKYRMIFAPHIMLFSRKFVATIDKFTINRPGRISHRYLRGNNIHIDLGSHASTDMRYALAADIYLGDASSQIYEFLIKPRPCIFINSHGINWQGDPNFLHWTMGDVIHHPDELPAALDRAFKRHEAIYKPIQEALFADSFSLSERPSSEIAAQEIIRLAGQLKGPIADTHPANIAIK